MEGLRSQFKKEDSTRSLPPTLETLLLRRYGAHDVSPGYLDQVVAKGREALGMTANSKESTEKLETWCHGYMQAQLADPAFSEAQRLQQMTFSKPLSSPRVEKTFSFRQNGYDNACSTATFPPREVHVIMMREASLNRKSSRRSLMIEEDETLESIPKLPVRQKSGPSDGQLTNESPNTTELSSSSSSSLRDPVRKSASGRSLSSLGMRRNSLQNLKNCLDKEPSECLEERSLEAQTATLSISLAIPKRNKSSPARGILPDNDEYDSDLGSSGPSYLTATMGAVNQTLKKQQSERSLVASVGDLRSMMTKQHSDRTMVVSVAPSFLMKKQQSERALVASGGDRRSMMRKQQSEVLTPDSQMTKPEFPQDDTVLGELPSTLLMTKQRSERSLMPSSDRRLMMKKQQSEIMNPVPSNLLMKKQQSRKEVDSLGDLPLSLLMTKQRSERTLMPSSDRRSMMKKQQSEIMNPFTSALSTKKQKPRKELSRLGDLPPALLMAKQRSERALMPPIDRRSLMKKHPSEVITSDPPTSSEAKLTKKPKSKRDFVSSIDQQSIMKVHKESRVAESASPRLSRDKRQSEKDETDASLCVDLRSTMKQQKSERMKKSKDLRSMMKKPQSAVVLSTPPTSLVEQSEKDSVPSLDLRSIMKKQKSEREKKSKDLRSMMKKQQSEKTIKASGGKDTSKKEKKSSKEKKELKETKKAKKVSSKQKEEGSDNAKCRRSLRKKKRLATQSTDSLESLSCCTVFPVSNFSAACDEHSSASSLTFGTYLPQRNELTEELNVARWSAHPFKNNTTDSKTKGRPELSSSRSVASHRRAWRPIQFLDDDSPKLPKRTWEESTRTLETYASSDSSVFQIDGDLMCSPL